MRKGALAILALSVTLFIPRKVTIYVSSLSVPGVDLTVGDTLREVTARPTDNRGYYSPRSTVTWSSSPAVQVLVEPGTLGQRVQLVAKAPNPAANVIATSVIANQTVRDTLVVSVVPAPVDTTPAYQRFGCSLDVPTRLDSLVRLVTVSGSDTTVRDVYAYFKVAGKQIVFHADSTPWHFYKIPGHPQAGDTLQPCPLHL